MEGQIGQLLQIDVKEIWKHEAINFTPWLAENVNLLGQVLGLELELDSTEKSVGPFKADILCRDLLSDQWVLIENQLEKTDHSHLGQLITYASGLEAATIVWIARSFTEEHRAAIDWLNDITAKGFNFFGIEIELWRIGDSLPAPRFNVVAKPNDWKKSIKKGSNGYSTGDLSEMGQKRLAYWTQFKAFLENSGGALNLEKATAKGYAEFPTDVAGVVLAAYVSFASKAVGCFVRLQGQNAESQYLALHAQKDEIEKAGEGVFSWSETTPRHKYHLSCALYGSDPENPAIRGQQYKWLQETLENLGSFVCRHLNDL